MFYVCVHRKNTCPRLFPPHCKKCKFRKCFFCILNNHSNSHVTRDQMDGQKLAPWRELKIRKHQGQLLLYQEYLSLRHFQTAHISFECTNNKKNNILYCVFCEYLMLKQILAS